MCEDNLRPYTIRLFVTNGNPNSFKIIDKMNWWRSGAGNPINLRGT